jgi:hypothetical protein
VKGLDFFKALTFLFSTLQWSSMFMWELLYKAWGVIQNYRHPDFVYDGQVKKWVKLGDLLVCTNRKATWLDSPWVKLHQFHGNVQDLRDEWARDAYTKFHHNQPEQQPRRTPPPPTTRYEGYETQRFDSFSSARSENSSMGSSASSSRSRKQRKANRDWKDPNTNLDYIFNTRTKRNNRISQASLKQIDYSPEHWAKVVAYRANPNLIKLKHNITKCIFFTSFSSSFCSSVIFRLIADLAYKQNINKAIQSTVSDKESLASSHRRVALFPLNNGFRF